MWHRGDNCWSYHGALRGRRFPGAVTRKLIRPLGEAQVRTGRILRLSQVEVRRGIRPAAKG